MECKCIYQFIPRVYAVPSTVVRINQGDAHKPAQKKPEKTGWGFRTVSASTRDLAGKSSNESRRQDSLQVWTGKETTQEIVGHPEASP
jgi:hypothetical protein